MICGKCSKNHATVHVTEVVNGVKKESHLCEECARAAGGKFTFSITDILANLIEPVKPAGTAKSTEAAAVGSSRVDLQACKLEYSIVSPK